MSGIPVILCGKSPTLAKSFISSLEALGPQVDVVHVIHDFATGAKELPALLRGSTTTFPSSSLGSNSTSETGKPFRTPRAVVVGKGFSEEEIEGLRGIEDAQKVPWLLPDDQQMTWTRIAKVAGTAGMALPGIVAERVVQCLEKNGMLGEGADQKGKEGQVWWF